MDDFLITETTEQNIVTTEMSVVIESIENKDFHLNYLQRLKKLDATVKRVITNGAVSWHHAEFKMNDAKLVAELEKKFCKQFPNQI